MIKKIIYVCCLIALSPCVFAEQKEHKACVFDIMGAGGEVYSLMQDYALFAQKNEVVLKLVPYLDERVAAEDFKAGRCDIAVLTGLRGRQFNSFTGSIDAVGAVLSNNTAKAVMSLMANSKLNGEMVYKQYEVGGVFPMGSAYLLVKDRSIDSLAKIAGKRFAVLDYDKAQRKLVEKIGAVPVATEVSTLGGKFNNGQVDIIGVPAMAFRPLELYKGLGQTGAIVHFPVLHLTGDIILSKDKFEADFAQKSRAWTLSKVPQLFAGINRIENAIPKKYWMEVPADDQLGYIRIMRDARISLTADGIYNPKMMKLIKMVRCKQDPSSFECALKDE